MKHTNTFSNLCEVVVFRSQYCSCILISFLPEGLLSCISWPITSTSSWSVEKLVLHLAIIFLAPLCSWQVLELGLWVHTCVLCTWRALSKQNKAQTLPKRGWLSQYSQGQAYSFKAAVKYPQKVQQVLNVVWKTVIKTIMLFQVSDVSVLKINSQAFALNRQITVMLKTLISGVGLN